MNSCIEPVPICNITIFSNLPVGREHGQELGSLGVTVNEICCNISFHHFYFVLATIIIGFHTTLAAFIGIAAPADFQTYLLAHAVM